MSQNPREALNKANIDPVRPSWALVGPNTVRNGYGGAYSLLAGARLRVSIRGPSVTPKSSRALIHEDTYQKEPQDVETAIIKFF